MKKLLIMLFLSCFTSTMLFAQITLDEAVDFTVKGIDGNSHHLFEYLDAGNYVLIDFWATW